MNRFTFDDLIQSSAGDGGVTSVDWQPTHRVELASLMQAWSIERGHRIECEILLELSKDAIAQLLAADRGGSTPDHHRNLQTLLRRINSLLDVGASDRA